MISTDLVVCGAGPAGLMGALLCGEYGIRVTLVDSNLKPGRKLLVSGSGKCNVSNTASLDRFCASYGQKSRFVKSCLSAFGPDSLRDFFERRGLPLVEAHDGKLFPETMCASDVLDVLYGSCMTTRVGKGFSRSVESIEVAGEGNSRHFVCTTSREVYHCSCVLMATGGCSWPTTGSDGSGISLAASLGHTIVTPRPALAPVYPRSYDAASCSGLACEQCEVSLWRNGRKILKRCGDVLFTHRGLSGPGILDISRYIDRGDRITLNLVSLPDESAADTRLRDACAASPKKNVKNIVTSLGVAESLAVIVLARSGCAPDCAASDLPKNVRKQLAKNLVSLEFEVDHTGGFSEAMATAGGIHTDEVIPSTMESRLVKGLFFAGEVLDVDGDTGGYNIHFALASARAAAQEIFRRIHGEI